MDVSQRTMIDIGLAVVFLGFCVLGAAVIIGAEMVTRARDTHRRSGQIPPYPMPSLPPGSDARRRKVVGKAADIVRDAMHRKP